MIDRKVEHSEKVTQIRSALESKLKTRAILGLKYHVLTQNSQRVVKAKLDKMLLVKAINAFKYFSISQRISRSYAVFREAKVRKEIFAQWRARYLSVNAQKDKLRPLLAGLVQANRANAFKLWKKNCFRIKFAITLR